LRLGTSGIAAVSDKNYEAVLNALKRAGVEVEGTSIKLVGKPRTPLRHAKPSGRTERCETAHC
jgi:hypothetical protein